MVKIGHAVHDENKKAKGGQAGDQTGDEVKIANWYNKPWTHVFRPEDEDDAEMIAATCEAICVNDYVGYDQSQRTTLFDEMKKHDFDVEEVETPVETDCSALVAVCVNAAGINVSKSMYTGSELAVLKNTGKFEILTDDAYTKSYDRLKRGDILLGQGHTAIVLSDGENADLEPDDDYDDEPDDGTGEEEINNPGSDNPLSGTGIGVATAKGSMRIRAEATPQSRSYGIVRKGKKLEVLDILSNGWYKIVWDDAPKGYAYTSNVNGQYYKYEGEIPEMLTDPLQPEDGQGIGKYILIGNYNLRKTPGADNKPAGDIIIVVHKGSFFTPDGESAMIGDTEWLHGTYSSFTGWISTKGLRKY